MNVKCKIYNQRIINVGQGTFTPLDFLISGGEGTETSMFHKQIAAKITAKMEDKIM